MTTTPSSPEHQTHLRGLLETYMAKKGLRSTEQRRLIVDQFFLAPAHITIEDLLTQVRAIDARIGYATVYRTLKLLAECGVAHERRFHDGVTRYEVAEPLQYFELRVGAQFMIGSPAPTETRPPQ